MEYNQTQVTLNNLFIFEMANSHQGSVEHGLKIIKEMGKIARKYNIKAAIKLQYRNLDTFIHPDYLHRDDVKHIPRFLSTRLTYDEFSILVDSIRSEGLIPMSTPFDEDSVEWCVDQGLDIIKIASCSATDWPLLEAAAKTGRILIVSTGGKSIEEVDRIYNFLIHRKCEFALMHCIAEYPAPEENIQLDFIDKMRTRYRNVSIGYSGHEAPDDNIVPMLAVAKGARIFERHIALPTETIKINAYSMTPAQADCWVESILRSQNICSLKKRGGKYISQNEIESLNSLMRGTYLKHRISKGESVLAKDVYFAMPCNVKQLPSGQFKDGITASRDYNINEALSENIASTTDVQLARNVIHEAKGLLYEAGIEVGNSVEIELSHHYGMKYFRQTGAIIINVINREYCKKIIIVLPGQRHPSHYHKIKEETFQLLYGELQIVLNSNLRNMIPGDIQTVKRGDIHSFSSKCGAIFEEISTTHVKNDSFYEDEEISKKDLIERKTIVKEW